MCCMMCVEYEKGKMTSKEALNNIGEMIGSTTNEDEIAHLFELAGKIVDKELPFEEWDDDSQTGILDELDKAFGPDED